MQKQITRDLLRTAFALLVATGSMLIGCGGGGGSEGRQILPGENPVGPVIITGTGTGTGTNTGTGTGTGTTTTVAQKITDAWAVMDSANWGGAISHFSDILADSRSTPEQRQQAYNGRGWAKAKYYSTIEGLEDFKSAVQLGNLKESIYKESLLGYALCLIQVGGDLNIKKAVDILADDIGLKDPLFKMTIEHLSIGVSSPEAHSMLAYAYFWRGNSGDAALSKSQIIQARIEDTSITGTVYQVYTTLKAAGLDI